MSRHCVPTPGAAILEGIEWLKIDKSEFARRVGVSVETLDLLISGKLGISTEIANALESVTGSPAAYWKMLERKSKEVQQK